MAIVKMVFTRDEFCFRVEDHEVSVETFGKAAFSRCTSGEPRRTCGHPPGDIRKRESADAGLGPHHRERQREAGNSTPRRLEIPLAQSLHLGRARRMVRRHKIDYSVA